MTLNDQDPMPFGCHKGTPMEKVPASYLLYLWDEFLWPERQPTEQKKAVRDYIVRAFNALETEATRYFVIHRPGENK